MTRIFLDTLYLISTSPKLPMFGRPQPGNSVRRTTTILVRFLCTCVVLDRCLLVHGSYSGEANSYSGRH